MKVVAALSGGVDSAVAASRAVDAGHDVTAVHLALTHGVDGSGCCTPDDARDARRVADVLGIPFYVWDLADTFASSVIDDFVASYASGQTPNPCVRCNERIKFSAVLDRARALGFDGLVTGHHARIEDGVLRRSVDREKDQSYVLGTLRADQLAGAVFPVGVSTKTEVRAEASTRGLLVADKPDSYDVCFAGQDTAGFLRGALGSRPGPIVDRAGAVVGGHDGAYAFTVGQRRGVPLGGGTPAPRYVLSIEPASRTVVVGSRDELAVTALVCAEVTYAGPARTCEVQLRAHAEPIRCDVDARGSELSIRLHEAAYGIAPGQAAVLYDGDVVLGGAWISATNVGA